MEFLIPAIGTILATFAVIISCVLVDRKRKKAIKADNAKEILWDDERLKAEEAKAYDESTDELIARLDQILNPAPKVRVYGGGQLMESHDLAAAFSKMETNNYRGWIEPLEHRCDNYKQGESVNWHRIAEAATVQWIPMFERNPTIVHH